MAFEQRAGGAELVEGFVGGHGAGLMQIRAACQTLLDSRASPVHDPAEIAGAFAAVAGVR